MISESQEVSAQLKVIIIRTQVTTYPHTKYAHSSLAYLLSSFRCDSLWVIKDFVLFNFAEGGHQLTSERFTLIL